MKLLKRVLIFTLSALALIAIGLLIWGMILHKPLPTDTVDKSAESMAQRMEAAVNQDAWAATKYVSWNFTGRNKYAWNREDDVVIIEWEDKEVRLRTKTQEYTAFSGGEELSGDAAADAYDHAWSIWCNDSYWLQPIEKIRDPGVTLSVVQLDDGKEGLKVTHDSGGVTPGDSYVYLLDENGRPYEWRMWVSIIPVGGMASSWSGWKQIDSGAWISTVHSIAGKDIEFIQDLASGDAPADIGRSPHDFEL